MTTANPSTEYVPFSTLVKDDTTLKTLAAKKKTTAKKKVATKKVVAKKETSESKMDIAVRIFKKHYGKKPRKDILQMFQSEAGLTIAGSSTYYSTLKKKHGEGDS